MIRKIHIGAGAPFLVIFSLLLFCTDFKNNNPATTSFQGDYALHVSWAQPSGTMEVFKRYKIACVQGRDTFSLYRVDSPFSPMVVDTLVRIPGVVDTIVVHFTRPIMDTMAIVITGVRPNDETVVDTVKASVMNPYFIRPNAVSVVMGDSIVVSVSRPDNKPFAEGLFVAWSVNGDIKPVQSVLLPFSYIPPGQQTQVIGAHVQGASGSGFYLEAAHISIGGYKQNLTSAAFKTSVKLGEPLTLNFTQTDIDSSRFRIYIVSNSGWRDSSAFLDFTGSATIQLGRPVIDTNPQFDTVYTIDVNGLQSNTVVLHAPVVYSLPIVIFSTDSLIVSLNDTTPVTLAPQSTGRKFIWILDSIDTLKPDSANSATCIILLHDEFQHILKVTGVDQYGYAGNAASIRVRAQSFAYVVQPVAFPTQPKVNTLTTWIAGVKDTALARQKNACFHWAVYPPNYDSIAITGKDSGTLQLRWSDVIVTTITLTVTDNINNGCAPYTKNISVRRFAPSIKFTNTKPLSGKTTEAIKLTVSAADSNSDGMVRKILWQRTGKIATKDSTADTTWQFMSVSPDTFDVYAWARDNDGFLSQPDTIHVMVKAYRPFIQPVMKDTTVYINVPARFKVFGNVSDPTAAMAKYLWDFDGNGAWDDSAASDTIMHTFTNPGISTVFVKCRDNNKLESVPDTFSVTVSAGAPQRPTMKPDTVWINDDTLYAISSKAMNPGAKLKQWFVQWDAGGAWETDTSAVMRHAYSIAGKKQVAYYVKDNNGTSSDTVKDTVQVLSGMPSVASVAVDSAPAKTFIRDTLRFFVRGHDVNGSIDSIRVAWNGDTVFNATILTKGDSAVFANAFATSGTKQIRFRVYDDDGLSTDTILSVFVRLAGPVIDSMQVPATTWINDTNTYQVIAHDTNGTIVRYYFDWTNSGVWQDSSAIGSALGHFNAAGADSIRFGVLDNDTLLTISKKKIMVHLGVPRLWNPGGDTMFVVTSAGGGNDTLRISHFDTNGTIQTFYWAMSSISGLDTSHVYAKGTADSLVYNIPQTSVNLSFQMAVLGKDDDGNVSGDTFWLYPDAPPPAPTINAVAGTDSVTIYWLGKDVKDGNMTQYRVLLHNNSEPDSTMAVDILSNWKSGYRVSDLSQFDFMLKVKVAHSINLYYYQVQARDARESVTSSTTGHTFSY